MQIQYTSFDEIESVGRGVQEPPDANHGAHEPECSPHRGVSSTPYSEDNLFDLSKLVKEAWGPMDGHMISEDDYRALIKNRTGPTPTFAYYVSPEMIMDGLKEKNLSKLQKNGTLLETAVFPLMVEEKHARTWGTITGDGTWSTDSINGLFANCPRICSYMSVKGGGKTVITEGVVPYFAVLMSLGYVNDLVAFSRPSGYNEEVQKEKGILEHLESDLTYNFHINNNRGKLVAVVMGGSSMLDKNAGGYAFIAGYLGALYRFAASKEKFAELMKGIEDTVGRALSPK
jgi:hypothetical protein